MTAKTPEALELAQWLQNVADSPPAAPINAYSRRIAALLRAQHQHIEELEKAARELLDALDADAVSTGFATMLRVLDANKALRALLPSTQP